MISIESYVRRKQYNLGSLMLDPRVHGTLRAGGYLVSGFTLSAAGLCRHVMPVAMGAVWACDGWPAVLCALGGILGCWTFWGAAGHQGAMWILLALGCVLLLGRTRLAREAPLLMPALAALIVAALGVGYQHLAGDDPPMGVFLLRVALGAGSCWAFKHMTVSPVYRWLGEALGVLALAQIAPLPWLNLGFAAAGLLCTGTSLPAAALAGLALDLAQVTKVPMTAVAVLSYLPTLIPGLPRWCRQLCPCAFAAIVMGVCGIWDPMPVPGLLLGGLAGTYLPACSVTAHRRGEVGVAQVRLEMAAEVLSETRQLLLEVQETPVDEETLVIRAAERACGSCPCRKTCRDAASVLHMPGTLLRKPLLSPGELPVQCRKGGRLLAELHRSQEQARTIRADRARQKEYRAAVIQQYRFASEFLQDLSDQLPRRPAAAGICYEPEVNVYGSRPEADNGDRCLWFSGTLCKYYVLLCDGMGTGLGAVQEGKTACGLLRRMLKAGYPADHALQSLNSLCALRNRAGAVTVDLAEVDLTTGRTALYKWGAVPSYMVSSSGAEKIGMPGPPPGLSVTDCREQKERTRLTRDKMLVMVSDGVGEDVALSCCSRNQDSAELAESLIACGRLSGEDDVTVVTVRLRVAQQ